MEISKMSDPRRKIVKMAISALLLEIGFESAENECVESLVEMFLALLTEIGQSTRNYCELANRTQPVVGDFVIAMINMGVSFKDLEKYAFRDNRPKIINLQPSSTTKQLNILQAGTKPSHPSHIPSHLPPLPDPHAYIRTATYKQPVTEYEAIREKAANQKRDIEKALTKFLAKTSETHSLFDDEENQMFPLIACKPQFPTYMAALNPTDQIFDFEELEYYYQVANRKEDPVAKEEEDNDENEENGATSAGIKEEKPEVKENSENTIVSTGPETQQIDNPYLRTATVVPRKKLKSE